MQFLKLWKRVSLYILIIATSLFTMRLFGFIVERTQGRLANEPIDLNRFVHKNFGNPIFGIWKKKDTGSAVLFHELKGNAEVILHGDSDLFSSSLFTEGIEKLHVNLHEKYRISTNNASMSFENPLYDPKKQKLLFPYQPIFVRVVKANQFFIAKKCMVSANLRFSHSFRLGHDFLRLEIKSHNCSELSIVVNSGLSAESVKKLEVGFHLVFCAIIMALKLYFIVQLDAQLDRTPMLNKQVSLVTLLVVSTFELIFGFEQLVLTVLNFPFYAGIIITGISFFNLFFYIILKVISTLLRNHISSLLDQNPDFNLRKYLIGTYFKAHFTILVTFYASLRFADSPYLYVAWSLALMPQIVNNTMATTRFISSTNNLTCLYVLCMIVAIYNHYFKYNFFYVKKASGFDSMHLFQVLFFVIMHVIVITIQEHYSPFFFLPIQLKSRFYYNYFRSLKDVLADETQSQKDKVCVICLMGLDYEVENRDWEDTIDNDMVKSFIKEVKDTEVMVTPCNHYYHTSCLIVWMSVKMECPCCKSKLPAMC